ncbi:MAG: phosphoglycerate kinase, partial [Candidatus Omnitrophica bacterium]|nr:phosphoglycerate kinase [Candidatus Omnitrophota bacterium]
MNKMTVKDIDLKGRTVLMRADFNVPQDANLNITDDTRIRATLPTIKYILKSGAKRLILMSHLGRPDGKVVEKYSLQPVAKKLGELLGEPVKFLNDCVGDNIKKECGGAKERVVLLENLRFHAEEETNDANFAKQLANLGEVFVNDAFGTAHRAHASTEGVTHYLKAVAGFLLEKEIQYLGGAVANPQKPFVVILGGAKVSDKIGVIENLLPKCDMILIGGGMCYTFLMSQGKKIGSSKLEKEKLDLAKGLLAKAKQLDKEIVLPIDNLVVDKIDAQAKTELVGENIPDGKIGVDIGPKTIALFETKLKTAKTICWNGPLGIFEMDAFSKGTGEIAKFISTLPATTI